MNDHADHVAPVDIAREILRRQPFTSWLDAQLVVCGDGKAVIHAPIREDLTQHWGIVHGGVLAALADTSITFAAGSVLGPQVLTSGFTITFVRPAHGATLVVEATVVHSAVRQAVAHCTVHSGNEGEMTLCAVAQGTVRTARSTA